MKQSTIASLAAVAVILTATGATTAFATLTGAPAAQTDAQKLANLQPGNQWLYELSWPNGQTAEYILHADRTVKANEGVVYELKRLGMTVKGQTIQSYQYVQLKNGALYDAPNATFNNTNPGFAEASGGATIPANLKVGYTWRWSGSGPDAVNLGGPSTASDFVGRVLPSKTIETPLGKRTATVIEISEKVQWFQAVRRAYYVPGIGKVREDWLDGKGNVTQQLELKKFTKGAKAFVMPKTIDTRGG
jgi:hypothetical protein